jgi:DNA-binding HxlR family transcriptional regulator
VPVSQKSYDHYCAMAKALDVVGERWTLLVVRELIPGPRRYTDLLAGIPGIATDMLAARLKTLEEAELVVRRTLPPPAASTVYELTEAGLALEPVVHELVKWGTRLLGRHRGEAFRVHWLATPLRMMFRPDRAAGAKLVIQFESHGEAMHVRVDDGRLEFISGEAATPDVVIAGDVVVLQQASKDRALAKEALEKGRLRVEGKKDDIRAYMRMFGMRE